MFARIVVIVSLLTLALAWGARGSHGGIGFSRSAVERSSPAHGAGQKQFYVVRAGDTLWSIAASHYGGDPREGVWKLQQRNHLVGALVRPGERLVLP